MTTLQVSLSLAAMFAVSVAQASQPLTVVAWGDSSSGQLNLPADLTNATRIVAGYARSMALRSDGRVAAWGTPVPGDATILPTLTDVIAIDANFGHRLVVRSNGTVVAWGSDYFGETVVPAGLDGVVAVASGWYHCLALKSDGTVVGWGGQGTNYNIPSGLNGVVAIAAGVFHSLALKNDGTVVAWGGDYYGDTVVPAGLSNVVAIAAGSHHSLALKSDGTVVVWGSAVPGVNSPPVGLSGVVAIAAYGFNLALKNDGTVVAWGNGWTPYGETTIPAPSGLSNLTAISAGYTHGLALTASQIPVISLQPRNATVNAGASATFVVQAFGPGNLNYQWRKNGTDVSGATNSSLALNDVQAADASVYSVIVGNATGSATSSSAMLTVNPYLAITAQPQSQSKYVGNNVTFTVAATGNKPFGYEWLKDDVTVSGATNSSLSLMNIQTTDAGSYRVVVTNVAGAVTSAPSTLTVNPNLSPVIAIQPKSETVFLGALVVFNISANGDPPLSYQWRKDGTNLVGKTSTDTVIANVQAVDAGVYTVVINNGYGMITSTPAVLTLTTHVFTLPPPGTVVGLGTTVPEGLTNIVAVAAGGVNDTHSVALRDNGTVVAWGGDVFGQDAAVPAGLSNVVAIASGESFSLALKSDGTVTSWGRRSVAIPTDSFGVAAIAAKGRTALALKSDGTVLQMLGYGGPPPVGLSNAVAIAAGGSSSAVVKDDGTLVVWGSFGVTPDALNGLTNVVGVDLNEGIGGEEFRDVFGLALRTDSTVTRGVGGVGSYNTGLTNLPGFSNIVAVSVGNDYGLALKSDSTVLGYGVTLPDGLTNVSAISAGARYSLLITTNPPLPMLSAVGHSSSNISLSMPVFVSGYVLEAADDPTGTYVVIETFTNAPALGPTLDIPKVGPKKYYRLRKL